MSEVTDWVLMDVSHPPQKAAGESQEVASQQVIWGRIFFFLCCVTLTELENVIRQKITLARRWCDEKSSFRLISHLIIVYKFLSNLCKDHIFRHAGKMSSACQVTPVETGGYLWAAFLTIYWGVFSRLTAGSSRNKVLQMNEWMNAWIIEECSRTEI